MIKVLWRKITIVYRANDIRKKKIMLHLALPFPDILLGNKSYQGVFSLN